MTGCKLWSPAWKSDVLALNTWQCTLNFWSVDSEMTYNYSLALSKMDSKRFVHLKVCCCMFFFFFFHMYTRGLKEQWYQTVQYGLSLYPSSFTTSFITLLPSVSEADAEETRHFSPYCPVCQALLWESLTASELRLLQKCWLNPGGSSDHWRPPTSSSDWVCLENFNWIVKQK